MSQVDFLQDFLSSIYALILTVIGVVIGEVAVYSILEARKKPKFDIQPASKINCVFGFSVSMIKKNVMNARIRCNKKVCLWEDEKGGKIEKKDLMAGDAPSFVFPFQGTVEYIEDISKIPHYWSIGKEDSIQAGILVKVKNVDTGEVIYTDGVAIPKHTSTGANTASMHFFGYQKEPHFDVSIIIIGEGIEEKRNFLARVTLKNLNIPVIKEGKPLMDYVSCAFELKPQVRFYRRKWGINFTY